MPATGDRLEDDLSRLDRADLERLVRSLLSSGVALSFFGKRTVMEIARKVRPRVMRREPRLHVGTPTEQSKNLLVEGENLQAMVTLYKYMGMIDLIVTDPPYNTGQYFRYNDKWDADPNDPELGTLVTMEDGSRHTKWIKAMMPRLEVMKAMLKVGGVVAICIDDNELYHLGMLMDEVFGETNRLAVINWQKTYSPKKTNHVSTATEYVLVYAKDASAAKTTLLPRDEGMNARYTNDDRDPEGAWKSGDATAPQSRTTTIFAVQSPFTGLLHYPESEHEPGAIPPSASQHWRLSRQEIRSSLERYGVTYEERDLGDRRGAALVIKRSSVGTGLYDPKKDAALQAARKSALEVRKSGVWPAFHFGDTRDGRAGEGRPALKRYINKVAKGRIPWTFWADEEYETPLEIGAQSWPHDVSGHSQTGLSELDEVVGEGHGFQTVKPLKLIKKIIQIWCPPSGTVLDPYAGSGTTGHAVLQLNNETGADRRFILIEQGAPENGDKYARTLTWNRLRNAITGERPGTRRAEPLGGGFEYRLLTKAIDAKTVLTMQRNELIDVVLTSHWEVHNRAAPNLTRIEDNTFQYLVGTDSAGEGYFLIWDNGGPVGSLTLDTYKTVVAEAKKAKIPTPYQVYARYEMFQSPNVRFWKIPDKILAHLGLDENEEYNSPEEAA